MTAKSLIIVGALCLSSVAFAKSYDIVLNNPSRAGATELKPGEYKLKVEGSQVIFSREGKEWTVRAGTSGQGLGRIDAPVIKRPPHHHARELRRGHTAAATLRAVADQVDVLRHYRRRGRELQHCAAPLPTAAHQSTAAGGAGRHRMHHLRRGHTAAPPIPLRPALAGTRGALRGLLRLVPRHPARRSLAHPPFQFADTRFQRRHRRFQRRDVGQQLVATRPLHVHDPRHYPLCPAGRHPANSSP